MDDLISREQTHELLSERMRDTALYNACEDAGTILIDIVQNRLERWLNELPSAMEKGEWSVRVTPSTLGYFEYTCSECGEKAYEATKYCGHCGSYMWGRNE